MLKFIIIPNTPKIQSSVPETIPVIATQVAPSIDTSIITQSDTKFGLIF
jgi:hypothetical protein